MFPCDPRWPYPGTAPTHGATQDQVDGFNAMCQTTLCHLTRCPDGMVYPFHVATSMCPAPTSAPAAPASSPAPAPISAPAPAPAVS